MQGSTFPQRPLPATCVVFCYLQHCFVRNHFPLFVCLFASLNFTSLHTKRRFYHIDSCVMGDMKMGNIVPRAGFKPTSLAFWATVLSLHHAGSLKSPLYPCLPACSALCLRSVQTLDTSWALLGWANKDWLAQYQDNVTEWDIRSYSWWIGIPVGQHYILAINVPCQNQSSHDLRCWQEVKPTYLCNN